VSQEEIDAKIRAKAKKIVAEQKLETIEQARQFCENWIVTASQHLDNERFYRKECDKLQTEIDVLKKGSIQQIIGLLENASTQVDRLENVILESNRAADRIEAATSKTKRAVDEIEAAASKAKRAAEEISAASFRR
jgi:hypothetical protein